MEQAGFCKTATQELPIRLKELGVLENQDIVEDQDNSASDQAALESDL